MAKKKKKNTKEKSTEQERTKENCIHCNKDVTADEVEALGCEICDQWSCIECIKLPIDIYRYLESNTEAFPYICTVCTPKLPEVKEIIDLRKSHSDLLEKVTLIEQQQEEDKTSLTTIQLQLQELIKAQDKHTNEVKDLNETVSAMKARSLDAIDFPDLLAANPPEKLLQMITTHVAPALKPMINTEISEREQIEAIKYNLMISGMEENENQQQDLVKFTKMIKDEMDLTIEVESAERVPRKNESENPKLLRVTFRDMRTRKAILSKATTLRNSQNEHVKLQVYIRPDLTYKQLEESKNLTKNLRAKRTANPTKKYKIHRGKIIEVTTPPTEQTAHNLTTPQTTQQL
jgi:hypothetical protein